MKRREGDEEERGMEMDRQGEVTANKRGIGELPALHSLSGKKKEDKEREKKL